jgi:NAD(P)H-dependent nitrite reductase small subunit
MAAALQTSMADFIEVAKISDLPLGRAMTCIIGERRVALFHTANGFFATDNTCPHRGGPLGEGDIIGNEIVCPWHLWSFDVATGLCGGNPELAVATHEVKVDGDRVLVRLS